MLQMFELSHRGYRVIVGKQVSLKPNMGGMSPEFEASLFAALDEEHGFFYIDMSDVGTVAFGERLESIVQRIGQGKISVVSAIYPSQLPNALDLQRPPNVLAKFSAIEMSPELWHLVDESICMLPLLTVAACWPLLTATARVGLLCGPLCSLTENASGGLFPARRSYSGLASVIRSLGHDLPEGIVMGIHPGLWNPGFLAYISPTEAVQNFLGALFNATNEKHNGRVSRYTGELIPF